MKGMYVYMQLARIKFLLTFIDSEQWQEMMITHYKRSRSISERCCRTFSASYRTTSEQIQMCTGTRSSVSAGYWALPKRAKKRIGEAWHCTLLEGPRLIDSMQLTDVVWPLDCNCKVLTGRDKAENSCWSSGNAEMQSKSCFFCIEARRETADSSNSATICQVCQELNS